jgi:hypothetical protein
MKSTHQFPYVSVDYNRHLPRVSMLIRYSRPRRSGRFPTLVCEGLLLPAAREESETVQMALVMHSDQDQKILYWLLIVLKLSCLWWVTMLSFFDLVLGLCRGGSSHRGCRSCGDSIGVIGCSCSWGNRYWVPICRNVVERNWLGGDLLDIWIHFSLGVYCAQTCFWFRKNTFIWAGIFEKDLSHLSIFWRNALSPPLRHHHAIIPWPSDMSIPDLTLSYSKYQINMSFLSYLWAMLVVLSHFLARNVISYGPSITNLVIYRATDPLIDPSWSVSSLFDSKRSLPSHGESFSS